MSGYPTMIMLRYGKRVTDFKGKRTYDDILQFVTCGDVVLKFHEISQKSKIWAHKILSKFQLFQSPEISEHKFRGFGTFQISQELRPQFIDSNGRQNIPYKFVKSSCLATNQGSVPT